MITNHDHAAQYGVLIHTMEVAGQHIQWALPPEPKPGFRINHSNAGWARQPWRAILQHGGLREHTLKFGQDKAVEFRNFLNATPDSLTKSDEYGNQGSGNVFGGLSRLFTINKIDGKAGTPDSYKHKKFGELLDFSDQDYTVSWTHDWSLEGDGVKERIKSLDVIDSNNFMRNPMTGIMPAMPTKMRWNADEHGQNWGRSTPSNLYCCTFWPDNFTSYDQLYRNWNQGAYIKFAGEELDMPKRGTKDIVFVSSAVNIKGPGDNFNRIGPGRPYEMKSDGVRLREENSAVIIHLWSE